MNLDANTTVASAGFTLSFGNNDLVINDNIGIGDATPNQRLSVSGNILASTSGNVDLILKSTSANGDEGLFRFRTASTSERLDIRNGANTSLVSIASSGFVGIGSTSPMEKLTVDGGSIYQKPSSTSLRLVSTLAAGSGPNQYFVSGRYLYITDNGAEYLGIVDFNNPASPAFVSTVSITDAFDVVVKGRYAYVVSYTTDDLIVIDVGNPKSPKIMERTVLDPTDNFGAAYIAMAGNYLYIVMDQTTDKFVVVDISNPTNPKIVGSHITDASPTGIATDGRFVYVTDTSGTGTLKSYDVRSPSSPRLVNSLT